MIYILVQDSYATVFCVAACAELFHYIEGGELYMVESPYPPTILIFKIFAQKFLF